MVGWALSATAAFAESADALKIEGAIPFELQADFDYDSENPANERNNLFLKAEPELTLDLPAGFSIFAHGVVEQVKDADAGEDRYLEDEGLFVEDLFLRYENGPVAVTGGKLNPGFGRAWDVVPGVYGTDVAEDYEFAERIGVTAAVAFGGEGWGQHGFTVGTFFLDTSVLAHSLGTSRGTTGLSDGGVSNTEDFSSFNLVLEGGGMEALPGLEYHLAYIHQADGVDGETAETGIAGFAAYTVDLGDGVQLTPLVELVRFDDSGGARGLGRDYDTVALSAEWEGWNGVVSYTRRDTEAADGGDVRDHLYQVGFGYSFDSGLTADIAWKRFRESGVETDTVGLLFTYTLAY